MRTIIDYVEIYTEKPKNGCWIKKIVFTFPIPTDEGEVREIALESSGMLDPVIPGRVFFLDQNTATELTVDTMSANWSLENGTAYLIHLPESGH